MKTYRNDFQAFTDILKNKTGTNVIERPISVVRKVTPMNADAALLSFINGVPYAMTAIFNKINTDDQVEACKSSRMSATAGLNLNFGCKEEGKAVEEQIEFLNDQFDDLDFAELLEDILEAKYSLFKVIEPLWKVDGKINLVGFNAHENDLFLFDRDDIYINHNGKKLEFANNANDWFMAVKVRHKRALHLSLLRPYIIRRFGYDAWAHFVEVFSDPFRVGKYPDGADLNIIRQVKEAVLNIGQDGGGVLPESANIEFVENNKTGDDTFGALVEKTEASVSKVILGHSAAVDSTPGKLGTDEQAMVARKDLIKSDRRFALKWLYGGFVKPLLVLNFANPMPIKPVLTEDKVITNEELRESLKLYWDMGGEVNPEQFKKMGVEIADKADNLKKTTDFSL